MSKFHISAPADVTGLVVTPNVHEGRMDISWGLPGDTTEINKLIIERAEHGSGNWVQLSSKATGSSGLPSVRHDFAPLLTPLDYRVRTQSRQGMPSGGTLVENVTLQGQHGKLPFWLNNLDDLDGTKVAYGIAEAGDTANATGASVQQTNVQVISPGKAKPTMDINPIEYEQRVGAKYTIPAVMKTGGDVTYGTDVIELFRRLATDGKPKWFRDRRRVRVVKLKNWDWSILQAGEDDKNHYVVFFDWTEIYTRLLAATI